MSKKLFKINTMVSKNGTETFIYEYDITSITDKNINCTTCDQFDIKRKRFSKDKLNNIVVEYKNVSFVGVKILVDDSADKNKVIEELKERAYQEVANMLKELTSLSEGMLKKDVVKKFEKEKYNAVEITPDMF